MKLNKPNLILNFIALLAGAQLPLAFAPFNIYPLALISPALLLAVWLYATPRQAFGRGLLYGLSCFGVGVSWVYISIHTFGNAGISLAVLITLLLIVILALFPAVQGYLLSKFFPRNNLGKLLLAFPASWVIFEWIRSWFLTGFPWLLLGNSQLQAPLRGIAPIFGVYGVSFAVALTVGAVMAPFISRTIKAAIIAIITLALLWGGSTLLCHISWTKPYGQPITVSLIQGNIPQQDKWQPWQLPQTLGLYQKLTAEHWSSQLIIWPEAAIPIYSWQAKPYLDELAAKAKQHHSTIITGIPIADRKTDQYFNGMLSIGINHSRYLKRHLVPFGEYPLFPALSKELMHYLHIPMSSFTPGPAKQPPFKAANLTIAPFICYEIAFPNEALTTLPQAKLLVTLSDDSWFGRSIAAKQQFEIARMRSLETGRYQLVATNTGITGIIRPDGSVQAQAPEFKQTVLTAKIQPMAGPTPWISIGHYLWLLFAALVLVAAIIIR